MPRNRLALAVLLAASACKPAPRQPAPVPQSAEIATPAPPAAAPSTAAWPPAPGTPGGLPDDRTPIAEGKIDPKSAQGAAQVVQQYGILLHERKFADARALWDRGGDASGMSATQFIAAFARYADIDALVGAPSRPEGAAGSSYVTVPLQLYGTLAATGKRFNLIGPVTLRRVNDVDGAPPEQCRWHISDSALKPTL